MAQKIVAGNWKMNLNRDQAISLLEEVSEHNWNKDVRVLMFPPALFLSELSDRGKNIEVGSQNFFPEPNGAFTGELSIAQLKSVGAEIALIGHSERRMIFNEDDMLLKRKVDAALEQSFPFIFCCGEPLAIREMGSEFEFVKTQLEAALFHLNAEQMSNAIIAYEPVWAIGTGKTATSEQAEAMHAAIRSWVAEKYDQSTAENVTILYGGSCNQNNAKELFSCPNVDGGLIGGAALQAASFCAIIDSF